MLQNLNNTQCALRCTYLTFRTQSNGGEYNLLVLLGLISALSHSMIGVFSSTLQVAKMTVHYVFFVNGVTVKAEANTRAWL